jgi:hypothetical protein
MSRVGVVSRGRQLGGEIAARLHERGIELVPFATVGVLVIAFWCALSLPSMVQRAAPRRKTAAPAVRWSVQPRAQFRVIASSGGATMPELRRHGKRSRHREETWLPAAVR